MNRVWLSMIGMVVYGGIGLMAPSALAFDSLLAEATVSFGAWDPKATNLLPAEVPLDRLVRDPGMGRRERARDDSPDRNHHRRRLRQFHH